MTIINRQKGFTLMEVILMIVVLSILAFAAVPWYENVTPVSLDAAAQKIKTDIRYAQSLATATGTSHGFRVVGPTIYEIYNVSTNAVVTSPYHNQAMRENLLQDFGNIIFQNQNANVVFNNFGRPTVGGGTNIQINYGGSSKTIAISSSGQVNIP